MAACAFGHRSQEIEQAEKFDDVGGPCVSGCVRRDWRETIVLAGSFAAFAAEEFHSTKYGDCFCDEWHIVVRDLRTGRVVHRVPTGPHHGNAPFDYHVGLGPALRVVAKSDGSVAWMNQNNILFDQRWRSRFGEHGERWQPGLDVPMPYELRVDDRAGVRLLAAGDDLDPHSLTLTGSALHWTQGGKPRSAHWSEPTT